LGGGGGAAGITGGGPAATGGAGGAFVAAVAGGGALGPRVPAPEPGDGTPVTGAPVALTEGAGAAAGGDSAALCTAPRGAGSGFGGGPSGAGGVGGPDAAESDALAVGADVGAPGGGGEGIDPVPNNPGDDCGEDGSAIGVAAAMYSACARSATRPWVIDSNAFLSGVAGLGGTAARFGYGWLLPGGGGRCSAISPPSRWCHQFTGLIDDWELDEHPASSSGTAMQRAARPTA
jgi:hypothetical protein